MLSHDSYILFYAREGTPWFSRAFEEMQPLLEASLSSPKSVLDPTNGECLSEISYENGDKPNKPCDSAGVSNPNVKIDENCVSLSNEPNEDVFLSAGEDSPMAELLDPLYDSYPPCTEPSDSCLAVERAIAGDEFVSVLMVQNKHSSPKQQGTILFNLSFILMFNVRSLVLYLVSVCVMILQKELSISNPRIWKAQRTKKNLTSSH